MKKIYNFCIVLFMVTILLILSGCSGAHSSPESVVKAWLEAVAAGDCGKAASYYAPDRRDKVENECGPNVRDPIVGVKIDEIVTRPSGRYPNLAFVTVMGEVQFRDQGKTELKREFWAEEIDGKWYYGWWPR